MNKKWIRPTIQIWFKGTPEEGVLSACKRGEAYIGGPAFGDWCVYTDGFNLISCKREFST